MTIVYYINGADKRVLKQVDFYDDKEFCMTDQGTLISVTVPIYNVGHYLRDCLDSLVCQTYQNLEIILVDDGSTDDSGKICDEYAESDSRITVMHLENAGVANARNKGIEASHGQYLMFVDGDDLISPIIVETLVTIHTGEADSIACCDAVEFQDGKEITFSGEKINVQSYDNATFIKSMYIRPRIIAYPFTVWGKLFPRLLIGDIKFKKIEFEDNIFNTEVIINHCRLIKYTDAKLYAYRRHHQSTMAQLDDVGKKYVDSCYTFYHIQQILPPDYAFARGMNLSFLHYRLILTRNIARQYHTKHSEEYRYAQHVLKDLRKKTLMEFVTNKYIPLGKKILYLMYESFPKLYTLKHVIDYYLLHKWT